MGLTKDRGEKDGNGLPPYLNQKLEVAHLVDSSEPPEATKLARVLWRVAKHLIGLLEKEYGFGK